MTSLLVVAILTAAGFNPIPPAKHANAAKLDTVPLGHVQTTAHSLTNPIFLQKAIKVMVTAYSSTPEETDDTPFITASGKMVREGIVATNLLPLGSHIKIPSLYGDKVFVVEDRMHPRKANFVDIWMPSKKQALRFGIQEAEIVILDGLEI